MLLTYTAVPFTAVLSTAAGTAGQDGCRRFSRHSCSLRYSYKLNEPPYFTGIEFYSFQRFRNLQCVTEGHILGC